MRDELKQVGVAGGKIRILELLQPLVEGLHEPGQHAHQPARLRVVGAAAEGLAGSRLAEEVPIAAHRQRTCRIDLHREGARYAGHSSTMRRCHANPRFKLSGTTLRAVA
jgi:hypothetical protein